MPIPNIELQTVSLKQVKDADGLRALTPIP
jgi:hypothetical protein